MIRHRKANEVRLFDYFKLAVLLILIVLMFVFGSSEEEQQVEEETAVSQIEVTATPTPTPTPTAEAVDLVGLFGGNNDDDEEDEEIEATPTPMPEDGTSSASTSMLLPDDAISGEPLNGTGTAGTIVKLINEADETLASAVVADDGTWEMTPELPAGTYLVRLQTYSAEEALLDTSEEIELVIQAAEESSEEGVNLPRFTEFPETMQSGFVTLTGEAQPNEMVTLAVNDQTVGTVEADENGRFSFPLYLSANDTVLDLTSGGESTTTQLMVTAREIAEMEWQLSRLDDNAWQTEGETIPNGTVYLLGGDDVPVEADENGRYVIPIPTSADAEQYDTYKLQTWQDGNLVAQSRAIQAHSFANHFFAWDTQAYEDGELRLFGIGETPNSTLTLYQNGDVLAEVETDENGRWSLTAPIEPTDELATITAERTMPDGSTSEYTAPLTISKNRAQPNAERFQWFPPEGELAGDLLLRGEGESGTLVQAWVDGVLLGETRVRPDGTWSLPVTVPADGNTFAFRVAGENGRLHLETDPVRIPTAESITTTPTITPTHELTPTEILTETLPITTTATLTETPPITTTIDLTNTIPVTETPPITNTTDLTNTLPLTGTNPVTTTSPVTTSTGITPPSDDVPVQLDPLVLTSPNSETTVLSGDILLEGIGTSGAVIEILIDGTLVVTTTVGEDGTWSVPVTMPEGSPMLRLQYEGVGDGETAVDIQLVTATLEVSSEIPTTEQQIGTELILAGEGIAGRVVEVLQDGELLATVTVAQDGTWAYPLTVQEGEQTITVQYAGAESGGLIEFPIIGVLDEDTSDDGASDDGASDDGASDDGASEESDTGTSNDPCANVTPGYVDGDVYVVGPCEYMLLIARKLNVSYSALVAANPQVTDPNRIYVGQELNIP